MKEMGGDVYIRAQMKRKIMTRNTRVNSSVEHLLIDGGRNKFLKNDMSGEISLDNQASLMYIPKEKRQFKYDWRTKAARKL
jgi:hypothetical protein